MSIESKIWSKQLTIFKPLLSSGAWRICWRRTSSKIIWASERRGLVLKYAFGWREIGEKCWDHLLHPSFGGCVSSTFSFCWGFPLLGTVSVAGLLSLLRVVRWDPPLWSFMGSWTTSFRWNMVKSKTQGEPGRLRRLRWEEGGDDLEAMFLVLTSFSEDRLRRYIVKIIPTPY